MNQNTSYGYTRDPNSPPYSQSQDGGYYQNERSSPSDLGEEVKFLRKKYKNSQNKVFHDFFKTKMCPLHLLNICTKGESCQFAHNEDELREKPNLSKTKLCEAYLKNGECKYGDQCSFAHGEEDLRSTPDLFKTAICNLWNQGKCTSGDRCRFAHGVEDLRPAPMHYKTKKTQSGPKFNQRTPKPMPIMQQQQPPTIYPVQQQFNPMIMPTMGGGPYQMYNFTPTYQEMPPQYYGVPMTFPKQMGISDGFMGKRSPF